MFEAVIVGARGNVMSGRVWGWGMEGAPRGFQVGGW